MNKICELQRLLYDEMYDLILITKTWLHDGISSGLLATKELYIVFKKDCDVPHYDDGAVLGDRITNFSILKMAIVRYLGFSNF